MPWMLAELLKEKGIEVRFTILEIGAVPLDDAPVEPFHRLLDQCPGSRVVAFEVDEAECARLNQRARAGVEFHAQALGRRDEVRDFHVAAAPMCSSLYPPNQPLCDLYHRLGDLVRTERTIRIDTVSVDTFAKRAGLATVDFIKIDVQGAELEIFQGAAQTLANVVAIMTEVEFVPLYLGQPLYEDVAAHLRQQGFSLYKLWGIAGRAMAPIVYNGNVNFPQQHLWADAFFVREPLRLPALPDEALFKLALLMECYGGVDLAHLALGQVDQRRGSDLALRFLHKLTAGSAR